jgi:Amt family ammonium transporter
MAALTWITVQWLHRGNPSVVGATVGAVAGLVGITPACGYVTPAAALLIGFCAALVSYGAIHLRDRLNVDDTLDVWAVHGVGGTVGLFLLGLFATTAINPNAANGLLYGNERQFLIEIVAILASWAWTGIMTFVVLHVVNVIVPLRVTEEEEAMGLDLSQHAEVAYTRS